MTTDAEKANEALDRQAGAEGDEVKREAVEPTREVLDASAARVRDASAAVAAAVAELNLAREQYAWDQLPLAEKERQLAVLKAEGERAEREKVTVENLDERVAASHPALETKKAPREFDEPFRAYDAEYNDAGTRRTYNVRVVGREGDAQVRVHFENGTEKVVPENEVHEGGVPRTPGMGAAQALPGV